MNTAIEENNYPKAIIISTVLMGAFIALSFIWAIGTFEPPEELGMGGMVVNYGTVEVGMGNDYTSVEEPSVAENANSKLPDKVTTEQPVKSENTSQTTDKSIITQSTEDAVSITTSTKKTTATPSTKETKTQEPTINTAALYKGKKNNGTGAGDGTGDTPGNQGSVNGDPLTPFYGDGGSGSGNKPLPLSKFQNLVKPVDDSQETGVVMVRIQVNKQGRVVAATAGVKGSTFSNAAINRKCEASLLNATLNSIDTGPEIRTFYVPIRFGVN